MDEANPRFVQHSVEEAKRHPNYLMVSTVPWPSAKGSFQTTIEWHTSGDPTQKGAGPRVRTLVERDPLDAKQAREKAQALAIRYKVPVILVVGR